eukprot:7514445-Pyramimonas_sp.AAC.1
MAISAGRDFKLFVQQLQACLNGEVAVVANSAGMAREVCRDLGLPQEAAFGSVARLGIDHS